MITRRSAQANAALAAGLLRLAPCLFLLAQCSSSPAPAQQSKPADPPALTPVLSVRELMEHIIDPTADWIFDAAVVDVSAKGVQTTAPASDEDWLRVERGVLLLAESSNLLKIPRPIAPPGTVAPRPAGEPLDQARDKAAPELSPAEIEAKVNANRALWNEYADGLRKVALASLASVKARNVEALFQIGGDIDKACESCHLEFWYPGDKDAVLADQRKKATYTK